MKHILIHASAVLVLIGFSVAQSGSMQSGSTMNGSAQGTSAAPATSTTTQANAVPIAAVLDKSVDAKKAKSGDQVTAKTMQDINNSSGQTIIPAGSKITGHITDAKPKDKDQDSTLTIVFDQVMTKNGQPMPITATIQGLSAPHPNNVGADSSMVTPGNNSGPLTSRAGNTGTMGGVAQGTGAVPPSSGGIGNMGTDQANGAASPGTANRTDISPNTEGAIGYSGMTLSPGPNGGTVITVHNKNVKLDSGTEMILRVSKQQQ
ncbi:MAG TPA: hypothetical protein VFA89_23770 [Terriglobales bacterium]|nr:hypothetical protein [Terriglobales bacterium]